MSTHHSTLYGLFSNNKHAHIIVFITNKHTLQYFTWFIYQQQTSTHHSTLYGLYIKTLQAHNILLIKY